MGDDFPKFTAAVVQAAPVFLDREATIDKACRLIEQAGGRGARLIVFPETWVPGYPFWLTSALPLQEPLRLFTRLFKNAVEVPSAASEALGRAAARAGAYVAIGINERDAQFKGSLYNTLLYIDDHGRLMGKHRKLMPSYGERTVWGWGDGSGLQVFDTPLGRVGGLICWEHEMPLVRYAMYSKAEQVHCSVWPAYSFQNDHIDFGCRQYAFEGACFVLVSCGLWNAETIPADLGLQGRPLLEANGGSGIIGPGGYYLAGPLYNKEDILYAEIDLEQIVPRKQVLDVVGHYARPDVVQLLLHDEPRSPVVHRLLDEDREARGQAVSPDRKASPKRRATSRPDRSG
ncbi:MAG: carbon-nitrogen hydrolase family protein [Chloroflexota bacterium]|nr:carbon-nitrogen hydrolase family protein [Chloroflexota bacterium]